MLVVPRKPQTILSHAAAAAACYRSVIMTYNHAQHKGNHNRGQDRQRHEFKDRRQEQEDHHDDQAGDDTGHARFRSYTSIKYIKC
jgi:hypothetical protein